MKILKSVCKILVYFTNSILESCGANLTDMYIFTVIISLQNHPISMPGRQGGKI